MSSSIFKAPFRITIKADGNELEFAGSRNNVYTYKYIKSETKKGEKISFNYEQLKELIRVNGG